ncbi:MAG TPA: GNAT family N-acetyltransferase [Anaerolineales bacterium]|nr:GNAT family N-acetyltransferase [Anaerolineales bacterium]
MPDLDLVIAPFRLEDQDAARTLILAGLEERWGALDETLNPDLRDIARTFCEGLFLCAWHDGALIGTGGWLPRGADTAEIVRMSVARSVRRCGVGRRVAQALLAEARCRGLRRIVLETTSTWADAITFYRGLGFTVTHHAGGDTYFVLEV